MKIGTNTPSLTALTYPDRRTQEPVRQPKDSNVQQNLPIQIGKDDFVIKTPQQVGYYIYKSSSPKAQLLGSSTPHLAGERPYVAGSIIRIAI